VLVLSEAPPRRSQAAQSLIPPVARPITRMIARMIRLRIVSTSGM
jgi:hypothetical protein